MTNLILLAIGSVAGGLARYGLAGTINKMTGPTFPYGILVVNVAGCFVIGILSAVSENKFPLSVENRILLMTGFCGAFTTFSALIFDSMNLIKAGDWVRAGLNVGGSVLLGCLAFFGAELLVKSI